MADRPVPPQRPAVRVTLGQLSTGTDRAANREAEGTAVIVWGGPAFTDTVAGVTMMPGCCVALDERDEVYDFLAGRSEFAYLGHSPDTGLATDADRIVITQHDDEGRVLATIESPRDHLDAALAVMASDIDAFLAALPAWTARHVPNHATELIEAVTEGLRLPASSGDQDEQ